MDQGSDDIRNNIEQTRAKLDQKLDSLEQKAKQTFDLQHQVSEHPFLMFGAAVLTGYVLGNMGGSSTGYQDASSQGYQQSHHNYRSGYPQQDRYAQHDSSSHGLRDQFGAEIEMIKGAAMATVTTLLRDVVKEVMPSVGQQLDKMALQRKQLGDGQGMQQHTNQQHTNQQHGMQQQEPYRAYQHPGNGDEAPRVETPRVPGNQDQHDVFRH